MKNQQTVRDAIQSYFLSTYHGNGETLKNIFHPDARITGIFKGNIIDWSREDFINRIINNPTAASLNEKFDKNIIFINETELRGKLL